MGNIKLHHVNPNASVLVNPASSTTYHVTVIHRKANPSTSNAINTAAALTLAAAPPVSHTPSSYLANKPR
jgi:hypothetical protein